MWRLREGVQNVSNKAYGTWCIFTQFLYGGFVGAHTVRVGLEMVEMTNIIVG